MMRTLGELNRLGSVRFMGFESGCGSGTGQRREGMSWEGGRLRFRECVAGLQRAARACGIGSARRIFVGPGAREPHNAEEAKSGECVAALQGHEVLGGSGIRMSRPEHFGQRSDSGVRSARHSLWHCVTAGSSRFPGPASSSWHSARLCLRCRFAIRPK